MKKTRKNGKIISVLVSAIVILVFGAMCVLTGCKGNQNEADNQAEPGQTEASQTEAETTESATGREADGNAQIIKI